MKAVVSGGGRVSTVDRETPSGEGVLVAVTSTGICGSDLHLVSAGLSGVVLGHEFGGRLPDGRLVAVRPTGECGTCHSCATGRPNTCRMAAGSLHGTSIDGGLAEFVVVEPARVVVMPDGMDDTLVALVEPTAVAVHGVNRARLEPGMSTAVIGAGSIGLLTAAVLTSRGYSVDVLARHPHQASAADAMGATALSADTFSTMTSSYDVTFDAVSTQSSFDACVAATRPGGAIVEFGLIWDSLGLTNTWLLKEISLIPTMFYSHAHDHDDFADAAGLLHSNPAIGHHLVTHRFPLSDATAAFDTATDRSSGAIKVHLFTTN